MRSNKGTNNLFQKVFKHNGPQHFSSPLLVGLGLVLRVWPDQLRSYIHLHMCPMIRAVKPRRSWRQIQISRYQYRKRFQVTIVPLSNYS